MRLSTQLMRLACDVDDLVVRVERRAPLSADEAGVFASAHLHLSLAINRLDDVLFEAKKYGRDGAPAPRPLTRAEAEGLK